MRPSHAAALRRFSTALGQELREGRFWLAYDQAFGAFPRTRAYVPKPVDVTGQLAAPPRDPRKEVVQPSSWVIVAHCSPTHLLRDQLCCLAREDLSEGVKICYAGEVYKAGDHEKYSEKYSLESGGLVVDGAFFCNEAAFVNHFYGIAEEPNCAIRGASE
ncbi:unnamed protein product, partial [Durusdinium trenchii]